MRRKALLELIKQCVPSRFETQREMAEALGFVPAHFSQMKSGNRPVGNESADRIERGLGLPVGSLDREPEPGADLLPSSNTAPQHSEVIFTSEKVVPLPSDAEWPFARVSLDRIRALDAEQLGFVQGRLLSALEEVEADAMKARPSKRAS